MFGLRIFSRTVTVLVGLTLSVVSSARAQHYNLGGPCADAVPGPGSKFREIVDAEKRADWNLVVELEKASVREACGMEFRWQQLGTALAKANRAAEAVRLLEEMEARGFELNPSPGMLSPELLALMGTPAFQTTPAGRRIGELRRISDNRRAVFLEQLEKMPAGQKPPKDYVAKGACPFECCQYRDWTVEKSTVLYAEPGSRKAVGTAAKGTRVRGLTGEVRLTPEPVGVVFDGEFRAGTIVFLLDYMGEGFGRVYADGKTVTAEVSGTLRYCFHPSGNCWGETLFPPDTGRKSVWWVKVRLGNGVVGWTDQGDSFGNKDACG